MQPQQPIVETEFLHKLERLAIQWQKSFPGLVGGHNISRFSGPGQEFLEHRHFHQGDDLRAVNWRAYLRLEKLFLKMFQVEPRIPVRLLLDTTDSMNTGEANKFDYARRLAAAICYIGLVRLDTICIQPFGEELKDSFVSTGGRHRFVSTANFLSGLTIGGRTDYFQVARQFISRYPQRGLLIVISDFLDDRDCEKPLQYLADFGNELILVHVFAPEDREPPWDGQLELTDSETGEQMEVAFDAAARENYTAAFDQFAQNIQRVGLRNSGRYISVPTSTPIEEAVFGPLVRSGAIQ
ncbi:MAG: DUF58 domain-containing protein [Bryobacteraceae bacterium]|jgi:uncharacterized protein (DUF58 family)